MRRSHRLLLALTLGALLALGTALPAFAGIDTSPNLPYQGTYLYPVSPISFQTTLLFR